ncbi:MAG: ATP-binding protein [Oscillospiraceae bacterium]|jgi:hypothetical protein
MNIKQAKEQIQYAMIAYFSKDAFGNYLIPIERQRPIFLLGAPGIGKTAIMEQIAQELGVGLVSYSMTHHTRQSALGLPFIVQKTYGGREYSVSEYTMSEIIASVYDMMETTGVKEGILFLDEINCVSETLAPAMLQFLQYKVFGRHRVPDGWIVVTAGNPPEYNKSVREFDTVTWDRLKRVEVEPDFDVWKEYAYRKGVHPAVMTYLEIRKSHFYRMETTVDGKRFVTARGWDDLSAMIKLYEQNGLPVDGLLIGQYLQNEKIAKEFANYYDLYNKYKADYRVDEILSGEVSQEIRDRAANAEFDECLALLGMLLDQISAELHTVLQNDQTLNALFAILKEVKEAVRSDALNIIVILDKKIAEQEQILEKGRASNALSGERQQICRVLCQILEEQKKHVLLTNGDFAVVKQDFDERIATQEKEAERAGERLNNLFSFCESVFHDGNELLILVTELTINPHSSAYISRYGCDKYFAHNEELMLHEREMDLMQQVEQLNV